MLILSHAHLGAVPPRCLQLPPPLAQQPGLAWAEVRHNQCLPQTILNGPEWCPHGSAWPLSGWQSLVLKCDFYGEGPRHDQGMIQGLGCPCLGTDRASLRVPEPPQPGHLPAMRVTPQEHQCCSQPGCWDMRRCHWAVPVGVALPKGNLSQGEGWCHVTWEHHPAPSMISLGVSGLCPGRVLPCRAPSWSSASDAGLVASLEQGGDRSQHSSWLSQLAPDGLCCPAGTCPRLATELS